MTVQDVSRAACAYQSLTVAQRKWLLRGFPPRSTDGRIVNRDFSGLGCRRYGEMTRKLIVAGLVELTPHGDVRVTDRGRRVASCMIGDAAYPPERP